MPRLYKLWLSACAVAFVSLAATMPARAATPLPADGSIESVIDHFIDARIAKLGVAPAEQINDYGLIRRLTLDLAGRIPTTAEVEAFVSSKDKDKRRKLVERLMASPEFIEHTAYEFELMLGGEKGNRDFRDYLRRAVAENRPWDRMFREMIVPEKHPEAKGAEEFLKARADDADQLANQASVLFFGVNVSCAKCHDHPLVTEWEQDHFYGMKSFFSRTFLSGSYVGEKDFGNVEFKTVAGETRQARLMFLTGTVIEEPPGKELSKEDIKKLEKKIKDLARKKQRPPEPKSSRRAKLVEIALKPGENRFFARSAVNRMWRRLLGRGLVDPVDQMHEENPPSHPELMEWLADDLVRHNYDLQRLIRGIVMSNAYSRSSRYQGEKRPIDELFAVGRVRPLTPRQYGAALRFASAAPDYLAADLKDSERAKRMESLTRSGEGLGSQFDKPTGDFQVSVDEALMLSNDDRIARDLLSESGDRLVGALAEIEDPAKVVETAVMQVLSRPATKEEKAALIEFLKARKDQPLDARKQLVWALLTSTEFRFNH